MKRLLLHVIFLAAAVGSVSAQSDDAEVLRGEYPVPTSERHELLRIEAEARVDYENYTTRGRQVGSESGFKGKLLSARIDGEIIPGLSYSWRQRFNKAHSDQSFWDATDWLYLDYAIDRWNFQVGKQVVAMGGWEYNRAPIDIMCGTLFWRDIACYQLGVAVSNRPSKNDILTFQVTQSPFFTTEHRNLFGYNLFWDGQHGPVHFLYSVNMLEYQPSKYISYIALGQKFTIGNLEVELDLMNRAAAHQHYFFKDWGVGVDVGWWIRDRWHLFGRGSYEINHSGVDADYTVYNGTELSVAGGGLEFYPLKRQGHTLRVHAAAFYIWGKNSNKADIMQGKTLMITAGISWKMNFFNLKRK